MIKCNNCKAYCCRKIGLIDPSLDRGDCVCKHLTDDNKCDIYDNRPLICSVDRLYESVYKYVMTREEYDELNRQGCIKLKEEFEKGIKDESDK